MFLFFCSRILSRTPHYTQLLCLLRLLLAVIVSQIFLVFDEFDSFEEYWSDIFRMSLNWDFSNIFLMIWLGLWVWERMTTEAKCHSHHIISKLHTINLTYHCWKPWLPSWAGGCQVFPPYSDFFQNSSAWEIYLCFPMYLFIQSFIYISVDSWLFILYFGL